MANMNVRKRVESIATDLNAVIKHVVQHSGIDSKDAMFVDNIATEIAAQAARLASEARARQGDRSAHKLVEKVRKALGFTYP